MNNKKRNYKLLPLETKVDDIICDIRKGMTKTIYKRANKIITRLKIFENNKTPYDDYHSIAIYARWGIDLINDALDGVFDRD